ncbi:hypothetical protein AcV5_000828 [Taiwanofungus camphoratus]|nr:hypothetical protein AcV5_000828 [Antrodia cinnamomea]KAI0939399.1 hypothetical protein AcV5_000828 [Antrodia cinnamomea]
MPSKRKLADLNSSDDEEPMMGRQVLPVANLPSDFSGIPMDGMQYLFTVRRDARILPQVTRVANPYEIKEEIPNISGEKPDLGVSHPALPSEAWREIFLRRFRNFRKNSVQPTIHVHVPPSHKIMPEKKDRDAWWAFISGRPESEWNPPKKPKQPKQNKNPWRGNAAYGRGMQGFSDYPDGTSACDLREQANASPALDQETWRIIEDVELASTTDPTGSLPTPSGTPAPPELAHNLSSVVELDQVAEGDKKYTWREPTPYLMQYIDHRYALHLLMYLTHWINLHFEQPHPPTSYLTPTHARWMFVLLSRVEEYTSADETSLLRNLARACMSLIKESIRRRTITLDSVMEKDEAKEDARLDEWSCWMVVTTIIGIWGQRDLWSDAEAMLATLEV